MTHLRSQGTSGTTQSRPHLETSRDVTFEETHENSMNQSSEQNGGGQGSTSGTGSITNSGSQSGDGSDGGDNGDGQN